MHANEERADLDLYLEEYSYDSMFGPAEVFTVETDEGLPLRCLYVGGGFQSATYFGDKRFDLPFDYCKAFDVVFNRAEAPTEFLVLGGGGLSYPKHLLTTRPNANIDVVEIDPTIVEIARKHFFVDELEELHGDSLRIYAEDGNKFMREAQECSYDVVINDTFAGTVQDAPLLSPESLELTKSVMRANGFYLLNAVVEDDEDEDEDTRSRALDELANIRSALSSVFGNVVCKDVIDENYYGSINHVFIASDGPIIC